MYFPCGAYIQVFGLKGEYTQHTADISQRIRQYLCGRKDASSSPSKSKNDKIDSPKPTSSDQTTSGRPPMPTSSRGAPIGSPSRQKQTKSPMRTPPTPRTTEKKLRTTSPVPKNSPKSPKPAPGLAPLLKPADAIFFEGDYLVGYDQELLQWHTQQYATLTSGEHWQFSSLPTYEDLFMINCDMYYTTPRMVVQPGTHDQVRQLWENEPNWCSELLILSEWAGRTAYVAQLARLLEDIKWDVYHIRRDPINFQRFDTLPGRPDHALWDEEGRRYVADLLIADFNTIGRIAKDYADVDN